MKSRQVQFKLYTEMSVSLSHSSAVWCPAIPAATSPHVTVGPDVPIILPSLYTEISSQDHTLVRGKHLNQENANLLGTG